MEFRASHRYAQISPRKVRLLADVVRGRAVNEALDALHLLPQRGAPMLRKVIQSAVANASETAHVDPDELSVARVWVDQGPMRRWRLPRSRGMWNLIAHRTAHIVVVLSDGRD